MLHLLYLAQLVFISRLAFAFAAELDDSLTNSISFGESIENSISFSESIEQQSPKKADSASTGGDPPEGFSNTMTNSGCYSYLSARDGCAYRNPVNNCAGKITSMEVLMFEMDTSSAKSSKVGSGSVNAPSSTTHPTVQSKSGNSKRSTNKSSSGQPPRNIKRSVLKRSSSASINSPLDSESLLPASTVQSSDQNESSICGNFDGESQMGVCLWSGPDSDGSNGTMSGWVSSELTRNCKKEVILQRLGSSSPPIVAKILEGCSFNATAPSVGCSQIYITKKTFMALEPSPSEIENGILEDAILWDFNSKQNIFNAAV